MTRSTLLPVAVLAWLAALSGCASPPPSEASLYDRLGGRAAIEAVVIEGIHNIAADPRINRYFMHIDAAMLKGNLVDLICERTGGPCVYRGKDMSAAHEGMNISDAEFDALVEDLAKSLDKFKVPPRAKSESLAALSKMKNAIVGH